MIDNPRPTILIVDYVIDNIKTLMEAFKSDYTCVFAKSGKTALEIAVGKKPDLILLDIDMPEMDGYEVCRRLKKNESTCNIPIIFVTGMNSVEDETKGLELGALDYITKPFSIPIVRARVKNHLELKRHGDLLLEANEKIMDSIRYARTIQTAFLPDERDIAARLDNYCILWKPKEIIGGDIYTFKAYREGFLIAVMDWTGHGVPGAIMTMIAGSSFDRALEKVGYTDPGLILRKLNGLVKTSLHQHRAETDSDDGLDIGVCYVDEIRRTLVYAGAKIDLYNVRGGDVCRIPADKQSIGYKSSKLDFNYVNHKVQLDPSPVFFMCTVGIFHQTGGPRGFSFGRKRFEALISDCHEKSLMEQKKLIDEAMENYRAAEPQLDDITIIGFSA
jgi:CheY-like chemotaxis protein